MAIHYANRPPLVVQRDCADRPATLSTCAQTTNRFLTKNKQLSCQAVSSNCPRRRTLWPY